MITRHIWKLSPSDFAFLWEECKTCFYLKVVNGIQRPPLIMPKIFMTIDSQMKRCFEGVRTESITSDMPEGIVEHSEKWVQSQPITIPGHISSCFIVGRFDTVVKLDDGTYGVVDFKTSERKAEHLSIYSRQLHAYAYALDNPGPGKPHLSPISKLGLLVFNPDSFTNHLGLGSLEGRLSWIEIPRNNEVFLEFLSEVLTLLEQPFPPDSSPECKWCQYRDTSRQTGL
jgi:hypothetical protein